MTSNVFVASRQRSDTPASLSPSSIPAQNAARRETLSRQYSLFALLIERGVRASDHGVSTPLPTRDFSPIILAFRSLREGAGSSTVAAAAAWHLGTRRESRVLAVAPQGTFSGFRTLFNLPPDVRPSDIFWRYTDSIFIAFTPDKTENNYSSHPPPSISTRPTFATRISRTSSSTSATTTPRPRSFGAVRRTCSSPWRSPTPTRR